MAQIPMYQQRAVQGAAIPGVRQNSGGPAEMFFNDGGAGQIGKGLTNAGNAMLHIANVEQEKADEARVQDAYAKLSKATTESIYGKAGVNSWVGESAIGASDKWTVDFEKVSGEISKDLTPRQKSLYSKYSQTLYRGAYDNVLRHEATQAKAFEDDAYKNLIGTAVDTAASSYRDGTMIGIQTGIAVDAMRKRPEYVGASAGARESMERDLRSAVHASVIDTAINGGDAAYANEYFASVKKEMPLAIRSRVEAKLKPATDFAEGRDLALSVQEKISKGEIGIVEGERFILEKARTKESAAVAQSVLREMQDAQRREGDKTTGAFIEKFELAPSRATMNRIMADPKFQAMDADRRANVIKYFRQEVDQADDRYRARQNQQTPERLSDYYDATQDPQLAAMTSQEIFGKYGASLGKALTAKLVEASKQAKTVAGKFQIDKDLLNEAIPKALLQGGNKDQLNSFKGIVESNLQEWKQNNPGKIPTLDEQRTIARSANAEYVSIGRVWNSTVRAYEGKQGAVPKPFYDGMKASGATEAEILAAWKLKNGGKR